MKRRVQSVFPKVLIPALEEYIHRHRPHLLVGPDPGTLFLNDGGRPFNEALISLRVALTLRFGGKRVTPHYSATSWRARGLRKHPDYLTVSKILWHSNLNVTLGICGSRFNESSGVCAMEA